MSNSDFISPAQHEQEEVLFDSGGTCDCYRLVKDNRVYCVKRPKKDMRDSEAYMNLFRKEFEMGSALNHPSIVRYVSYDEDEQGAYIRMNFVEGNNLEEFIAQNPDYFKDKRHRKQFCDELLSAMSYIHSKGMLHLDLKPRNILITNQGHHVKLIDLGFGWSESYLHDLGFTRDYCAPEQQAAKTELFSPATDIYALGKILQRFGLAKDSVVQRCLKDDPKERYQSVDELGKAMQRSETVRIASRVGLGLVIVLLIGAIVWLVGFMEKPLPPSPMLEGALNGLFTINEAGNQVVFSKGNLQYQASTNTWRFAEHQWDYVGNDSVGTVYFNGIKSSNQQASAHYEGWIDKYGWGTSGYNHGADCYQPWPCESDQQYAHAAYGCDSCSLYEQTGQADWGYNAISNGGNQEHLWRTLTSAEWKYLLGRRESLSGLRYAKAVLNGVYGLIIFPDRWEAGLFEVNKANDVTSSYDSNLISAQEWESVFEANGAVFLPVVEISTFTEPGWEIMGYYGSYWSSTRVKPWLCYQMDFNDEMLFSEKGWYSHARAAVRLVRDKE